jgi:hypothetical protein
MAYTNIDFPAEYFNTNLYTGNNIETSLTVGFQPDWVWLKVRNAQGSHYLFDVVRGATILLNSNLTNAEATSSETLKSFDSNGYTVGTSNAVNTTGETMVGWNWKANGAGVSNTAGTISSTVSANTTSGFSIVSYTGTGANATVGHGLGVAPKVIFVKSRSNAENWQVYHGAISGMSGGYITLNNNDSFLTNITTIWNGNPNSDIFGVGTYSGSNQNTYTYIAYCFAEVKGYSKFGSYTGNGSADGTFVYTGFKPAFVIRKRTDSTADWRMDDSKRDGYNFIPFTLFPNLDNEETTNSGYYVDLLSNGFKCRATSVNQNASGGTYIYMAFAENPFTTSTGIPTTAR